MPILTERRKFIRYRLPYGMLYVFNHFSARIGWVRDISMGGLSCEFNHENDAGSVSEVIDIFAYEKDFYLPSITCNRAFSLAMQARHQPLRTTRCGQHFVALNHSQQVRWKELVEKLSTFSDLSTTDYDPIA